MRLRHFILTLSIICGGTLWAGESATNETVNPAILATSEKARQLSLEECIGLALQHNLSLAIERINPQIAQYNLSLGYAAYDPVFNARGQHANSLSPSSRDDQSRVIPGSQSESDSFSSGISGALPWTGLTYDLSGNISDTYGTQTGFDQGLPISFPFENTRANAAITLQQPLLRNFWIDANRMNIWVNRKNIKISDLALQFRIMNIITSVELAYYDLIFARENVLVQEKAYELARRLLAENKRRVEVGAMAPLDEKQAESQAAARQADLLSAQRLLDAQQNVLKNLITDNIYSWQGTDIVPSEALEAVAVPLSLQDSWAKGMSLRPDLLESRLQLEKQDIVLRYSRNQLFPQLDVFGSYGHSASADEFSPAFGQIEEGSSPFHTFGAVFSIPLSNRRARLNHRSNQAVKQQLLLQAKQLEQNIMVSIEDAVQLALTNFKRVDATKQARLYAEAALEAEQKRLENGKSTSFVVLQLQRDLTSARSQEIRALADYNQSLANLSLAEGSTLERRKMDIKMK